MTITPKERAKWRAEAGKASPYDITHKRILRLLDALGTAEKHSTDAGNQAFLMEGRMRETEVRAEQAEAERNVILKSLSACCQCQCCPAKGPCDHTHEDVECAEIIAEWAKAEARKRWDRKE